MSEPLDDAILLQRFVSFREEAAFGALVERHGPLVQRICRRVLRNEHDAEDVFQATFLVLARRASGIAWRESVAGWLGAVAHRLALGARSDLIRQHRREPAMTTLADGHSERNRGLVPELAEKLNVEKSDVSLTPNCCAYQRNIVHRSSFAISRGGHTRKPRTSSDARRARCHGGSSVLRRSCVAG
jgi:Sigma-70 region 2